MGMVVKKTIGYCENIDFIAKKVGWDKILAITDKTCDVIECKNCPIHPNRIKLNGVVRLRKKFK